MNSPGTTPHEPCGDAGPQPRTATEQDTCPLCGERVSEITLEPTEYGAEWIGHCIPCNTIVELL